MDVRSQILQVATRRFAAHGYKGTSLQAIAEDVGIRKASLLYHFPSKGALLTAVLNQVLSHWNEMLPRLLEAAAGEDRFDTLLTETIRFFREDPDRARLLVREAMDRPEVMRERLVTIVRPWLRRLAEYVRLGQEEEDLYADVDPEAYLIQVVHQVICGAAMAETLGVLLSGDSDAPDTDRLMNETMRTARDGLFRPEGLARMEKVRQQRRLKHAGK